MKILKWTDRPFLFFFPFLLLFIAIIILFPTSGISGDEKNYLGYANNLLNGYYSPPPPGIDLQNSPGYPLIVLPFVALNTPLFFIAFLNAILFYFSIVFLFKSLIRISSNKVALLFTLFWAFYYNLYVYIPYVLPEILTVFLVSVLCISIINCFEIKTFKQSIKYIILSGIIIGYLALTKPIFGYVIITLIVCFLILLVTNVRSINYRKSIFILMISLITTAPYLLYTFNLTGKLFYWSSIGGNNLYWMSTPHEGESGSWINYPMLEVDNINRIKGSHATIEELHKDDFDKILKFEGVEQDNAFKKIAINNIKSHPLKFTKNVFSNISRILFNFPYSYEPQRARTLIRLPHSGIILVLGLFCIIPTILNWRKIAFSIRFLLFFSLIYLGGSAFGSAEIRMFSMTVPILLVWLAYISSRSIKLDLRWNKSSF
ncbi:MAG: glycosyltransferase family 39 protein [Ginsengibacter sp.]